MNYYHFYEGDRLLSVGSCPEGHEKYQPPPTPNAKMGKGLPKGFKDQIIGANEYWSMSQAKVAKEAIPTDVLWQRIRYERDEKLNACDWRVVRAAEEGSPLDTAWVNYRKALRQITEQEDPSNIIWPEEPGDN